MVLEQEGRGEKTMVINEFTSGKEDPKSGGGETGDEETRFPIRLTSGIEDYKSEGRLGYCLGH